MSDIKVVNSLHIRVFQLSVEQSQCQPPMPVGRHLKSTFKTHFAMGAKYELYLSLNLCPNPCDPCRVKTAAAPQFCGIKFLRVDF